MSCKWKSENIIWNIQTCEECFYFYFFHRWLMSLSIFQFNLRCKKYSTAPFLFVVNYKFKFTLQWSLNTVESEFMTHVVGIQFSIIYSAHPRPPVSYQKVCVISILASQLILTHLIVLFIWPLKIRWALRAWSAYVSGVDGICRLLFSIP